MPADGIGTRLFDVRGKDPSGVMQPELRACRFDPEHSNSRHDRDDRHGNDHLHDRESVLPGSSAVAVHLARPPPKVLQAEQTPAWSIVYGQELFRRGLPLFLSQFSEGRCEVVTFSYITGKLASYLCLLCLLWRGIFLS